jgi:hypothetical protein
MERIEEHEARVESEEEQFRSVERTPKWYDDRGDIRDKQF